MPSEGLGGLIPLSRSRASSISTARRNSCSASAQRPGQPHQVGEVAVSLGQVAPVLVTDGVGLGQIREDPEGATEALLRLGIPPGLDQDFGPCAGGRTPHRADRPGRRGSGPRAPRRCPVPCGGSVPPDPCGRVASRCRRPGGARPPPRVARPARCPARRPALVDVSGLLQEFALDLLHPRLFRQPALGHLGVHVVDRPAGQPGPRLGPPSLCGLGAVGLSGLRLLEADQDGAQRQPHHRGQQQGHDARDGRLVPAHPAAQPGRRRLAVGGDRLVGHPPLDVVGQRPGRRVAVLGLHGPWP